MWGFLAIASRISASRLYLTVMLRTWFEGLKDEFSWLRVDRSCFRVFWAAVFRGVSHLYCRRVCFGVWRFVEVWGRLVLDLGM